MLREGEIDGRHRDPVVRDGKVEFDSESGPSAAIGNASLFDRRVGVKHRLAGNLVETSVNVSSDIRQHRAFQILVLEINRAPLMVLSPARQVAAQGVGIVETIGGELVEGRVGTW